MAQPEPLPLLRSLPLQRPQVAAAVVVAFHPAHAAGQALHQLLHPLMQLRGHAAGMVNQITKDQQLPGLMALHQLFDPFQVAGIPIAG